MNLFFKSAGRPLIALALVLAGGPLIAAAPAAKAVAASPVVRIENFTFSPNMVKVKVGATVTWTNADDIPHNIVAQNGAFRSKVLDTGDSFSFKFTKAGEYGYYCGLHPHMVGKIIVTS